MNEKVNDTSTSKAPSKRILSWLPYIAIPLIIYFGNVEIQSYLGRKALVETGMTIHTPADAFDLADKSGKLVLMDISAIWCPSCRKLDNEVFANDKVKEAIYQSYVFTRVEYESREAINILEKYQIDSFPTLLVLDPHGNKLRKLNITFSPDVFIEQIKRG